MAKKLKKKDSDGMGQEVSCIVSTIPDCIVTVTAPKHHLIQDVPQSMEAPLTFNDALPASLLQLPEVTTETPKDDRRTNDSLEALPKKRKAEGKSEVQLEDEERIARKASKRPPADPQGYRYKKYGRKIVGGSTRHYYKCTDPECNAKRYITYQDGKEQITSVGTHIHNPPSSLVSSKRRSRVVQQTALQPICVKTKEEGEFSDLESFVSAVEQRDGNSEMSFPLSDIINAFEDGYSWLQTESADSSTLCFRCTVVDCPVIKRVVVVENARGLNYVTYQGCHTHARPMVALRPGPVSFFSDSLSSSGSFALPILRSMEFDDDFV